MLLSEICKEIGLKLINNDLEISGIHTLSEARNCELSFFNNEKYKDSLPDTKAAAVFIESKYASLLPKTTIALITDEPYLKLALASRFFAYKLQTKEEKPMTGTNCDISSKATFGVNVTLGDNVTVMAGVYIGDDVTVGDNTIINPNVSIYHHCHIGSNCIIHSGTVIGSDGFGFAHTKMGEHVKIYQNGNVIIEDDVEIGASCAIDRAVFGSTTIKKGAKLDNLIQIAHNCEIGEYSIMTAQVGLAGSTILGRNVVMGGQSASAGHLKIGDFAQIAGMAGVTKSLDGNKVYGGFPAIEQKEWLRNQAKLNLLLKSKK
ncbi:MAG: UDP-3-O-(3-hydroxymyristoyl)glucosamine N-acyltransferase [Sulfurovaceae bacterium]|nr:UDP-3-O-(3-hydroxymyristoyl)glucosamine N-acyltransferase [Sulfurovaceae bacterium]MDD5548856.1 UDP-3-O-(3-hydroxymyristoyl)glucosamine N-acyltransferase [Sulfurovaceae bacterium]